MDGSLAGIAHYGMNELYLRPAAAGDAAKVVSWFPTRESAMLWGGGGVPDPLSTSWLAADFSDPSRRYYVLASSDGELYGTISLRVREDGRLHIGRFGVAPRFRRQGVGLQMLSLIRDMARQNGAPALTLLVYHRNTPAKALYESFGFVTVDEPCANVDPAMMMMELRLP